MVLCAQPPHRRHIALPQSQFFLSDYEPLWPETFKHDHETAKI
jgi:hypothetical protein